MTLKLSRDQLEILRRRGATMRGGNKEEPATVVSQPTPPPASIERSQGADGIGVADFSAAVERIIASMPSSPQPTRPVSWRFEIERDNKGFAKSIIAHPITR